jgi:hypothetical protein
MVDGRSDGSAVQVFIGQDARHQCERSPIGNEGERSADQVDLAHPLERDRIRPLLVSALFERPEGHVSRSVGHRIEGANPTEERLQTLGMGNVRLVVAGLTADRDDLVSLLSNAFLTADPIAPLPISFGFSCSLLKPRASGRLMMAYQIRNAPMPGSGRADRRSKLLAASPLHTFRMGTQVQSRLPRPASSIERHLRHAAAGLIGHTLDGGEDAFGALSLRHEAFRHIVIHAVRLAW